MLTLCSMLWHTYYARNYAGMIRTGLAACKTSAMHVHDAFTMMVGRDGQQLWKVVGHLAILVGKRPTASSNF